MTEEIISTVFDLDEDSVAETVMVDTNADGVADVVAFDLDEDGVLDVVEVDTDADGYSDTTVDLSEVEVTGAEGFGLETDPVDAFDSGTDTYVSEDEELASRPLTEIPDEVSNQDLEDASQDLNHAMLMDRYMYDMGCTS